MNVDNTTLSDNTITRRVSLLSTNLPNIDEVPEIMSGTTVRWRGSVSVGTFDAGT